VDVPAGLRSRLVDQSKRFDAGAFVYMITVLEELRRSVKSSGSGRALLEAAVVRLSEAAKFSSIESLLARVGEGGASDAPAKPTASARPAPVAAPRAQPAAGAEGPRSIATKPAAPQSSGPAKFKGNAPSEMATPIAKRMTQADVQAAHAEPMVRQAMELFSGRIVHVERGPGAPAAAPQAEQ
jgi:hypothetical protein